MGNRRERGKRDDVVVKLRKNRQDQEVGLEEAEGVVGGSSADRCGTRRVKLIDMDQTLANSLTSGARLGWDTHEGRVLVVAAEAVLGFFSADEAAHLVHCVSLHHRYSVIWEGNSTVLVRKEA